MGCVSLRPVLAGDIPIFYTFQADVVACEMAGYPSKSEPDHDAHWRRILATQPILPQAILLDGVVVGNIVCFLDHKGLQNLGYWVGRDWWGQGVASEGVRLYLLEQKIRPLYAFAVASNAASIQVLQKNGFRLVEGLSDDPEEVGLQLG